MEHGKNVKNNSSFKSFGIKNNCAIISTVANFELYAKTSFLFPNNIPRYVVDGSNGMYSINAIHYMFKILRKKNIEWLIMADEDVIFKEPEKIFELINFMQEHNYQVAGVREGGVISHKKFNPFTINTFFSIIHFSEIEKIYNKKEINKNQYVRPEEFNDDLSMLKKEYDVTSLYEPYYCFYLWLKRKGFNFLYLDADCPIAGDELTTAVYSPMGDLLLYHTWYARAYNNSEKHTKRINNVLKDIPNPPHQHLPTFIFKDKNYGWQLKLKKTFKKIKMKFQSK